jgi:hypothetical protein
MTTLNKITAIPINIPQTANTRGLKGCFALPGAADGVTGGAGTKELFGASVTSEFVKEELALET